MTEEGVAPRIPKNGWRAPRRTLAYSDHLLSSGVQGRIAGLLSGSASSAFLFLDLSAGGFDALACAALDFCFCWPLALGFLGFSISLVFHLLRIIEMSLGQSLTASFPHCCIILVVTLL